MNKKNLKKVITLGVVAVVAIIILGPTKSQAPEGSLPAQVVIAESQLKNNPRHVCDFNYEDNNIQGYSIYDINKRAHNEFYVFVYDKKGVQIYFENLNISSQQLNSRIKSRIEIIQPYSGKPTEFGLLIKDITPGEYTVHLGFGQKGPASIKLLSDRKRILSKTIDVKCAPTRQLDTPVGLTINQVAVKPPAPTEYGVVREFLEQFYPKTWLSSVLKLLDAAKQNSNRGKEQKVF